MISTFTRWQEQARMMLGHTVSRPLHHVFNFIPQWELGLSVPQISRLTCRHASLTGCRAVQISDLHLDRYLPRHETILRTIHDLRPRWIFVTGDLLNVPDGIPHLFRFLADLRAIAPVYMTLGNHDHYSGVPVDRFSEMADRHKLALLINQACFEPVGRGELAIVGLDDPSLHRADLRCIPDAREERFTVLLAHSPNILDQLNDDHAVDVVLSGHSHGGQWLIPYCPTFWLPPGCDRLVSGEYRSNGHRLYVNRGLGWSVLPVRWNCPPEILLIEWTD
ncbi:MAG: metallophosphoesterase [Nitrospiraceae bacterium]